MAFSSYDMSFVSNVGYKREVPEISTEKKLPASFPLTFNI